MNILPSWDIKHKLTSVCRYPNKGQYSHISVQQPFYCIAINSFAQLNALKTNFCEKTLSEGNSNNSAKLILQKQYHVCTNETSYVI